MPPKLPQVLVACAIADAKTPRFAKEFAAAQAICAERKLIAVDAASLDWDQIRAATGSWDAGYVAVARDFAACIIVEHADTGIARGTFSLGYEFQRAEKPLGIIRNGVLSKCTLEVDDPRDWKMKYGRAVLK